MRLKIAQTPLSVLVNGAASEDPGAILSTFEDYYVVTVTGPDVNDAAVPS